ncbi:LPXTG cell wall anchor domain-containing protein [Nonomuraea sp. SMC257]|uniref:LPXTG cell wall anchor domain-containing protein n=1 Tax=Nonomuraea montanisoli TaxID=2741721 RepID=A0A7Y6IF43_9ACTN|nr:LPXTG cell wall anchor domain-containing protein [Nonomuraea montanisoli]NUW36475.1 LPXTG cell wall anchor domain-containing protein [Nonomuraea montanisoli]
MAVGGGIAFGTAGLATAVAHTAAAVQATTVTHGPLLGPQYPPCPRSDGGDINVNACLDNNNTSDNANDAFADAVAVDQGDDDEQTNASTTNGQQSDNADLGDFSQLDVLSNSSAPQPLTDLVTPGCDDESCTSSASSQNGETVAGGISTGEDEDGPANDPAGIGVGGDNDISGDLGDSGVNPLDDDEDETDESDEDEDDVTPTPTPQDIDKHFTVDLGPWDDGPWGHGPDGGCFEVECWKKEAGPELPMTGADVRPMVAAGTGLLLVGIAGTVIAVRRRRSSDAK